MVAKSPSNQQAAGKHGGRRPNSGGKRPNAGRPKANVTKAKEDVRAAVVETIGEWAPALLKNLKSLADAGDRAASEYLLNRLLGRPTEAVEVKGQIDHAHTLAVPGATLHAGATLLATLGIARAAPLLPTHTDAPSSGVPADG
jgi:hypothetical protein